MSRTFFQVDVTTFASIGGKFPLEIRTYITATKTVLWAMGMLSILIQLCISLHRVVNIEKHQNKIV
jgi:hypothetical protein